jgi:hypothetical protein
MPQKTLNQEAKAVVFARFHPFFSFVTIFRIVAHTFFIFSYEIFLDEARTIY